MGLHNIFGTDPLNVGAGYGVNTDGDPIILAQTHYVLGGTDGYEVRGVRIYLPSGGDYTGAYAYLWNLGSFEFVQSVAAPGLVAGWNDIEFSAPYSVEEYPGGRYFAVGVYLPAGRYVEKAEVFSAAVPSGTDANIVTASSLDLTGDPALGLPGNNCFAKTAPIDAAEPGEPAFSVFAGGGFNYWHYGLDLIVADPSEPPSGDQAPPEITVAPVLTDDGSPQSGETVHCSSGTITGNPTPAITRRWKRNGAAISGATSSNYTLVDADVGQTILCTVTATNTHGTDTANSNSIVPAEAAFVPSTTLHDQIAVKVGAEGAGMWYRLNVGATDAHNRFYPEDYGAIADGDTDCTAAINECLAAAVTAATGDGSYYCEVKFRAGTYLLEAATTKGGATLGNAQITLPAVAPESSQKVFIALLGSGVASAMHWAQTEPLAIGTVLRSTLTGLTADGTYGAPSVIGTPSVQVGFNPLAPDFSNIHVILDGLTVMKPQNPTLVSFDMRGAAQITVGNIASVVDVPVSTIGGNPGSNGLGIGLMCPGPGNNAVCDIRAFTSEGDNCAIVISEHVVAQRILALYNEIGVYVNVNARGNGTNHASTIQYLCAEVVDTVIQSDGTSGIKFALNILCCDTEIVDIGTHILDTTDILRGVVYWHDYQATAPRISGSANLHVYDVANNTHYGPTWTEG